MAEQFKPFAWQLEQVPSETYELVGRQPQSVSRAWNDGIAKAVEMGCEYIAILNEDIVLKSNAIDRLVEFAESHRKPCCGQWGNTMTSTTLKRLWRMKITPNTPTSICFYGA